MYSTWIINYKRTLNLLIQTAKNRCSPSRL